MRTERRTRTLFRLSAALLTGCLLAACAPTLPAPPPPSAANVQASESTDALIADDGTRLPLRVWRPHGEVHAVILALHGFNDYSAAFAMPAGVWAHYGIITYAYDQRGFGANAEPGHWPGAGTLCHDLKAALRQIRQRHPDLPVYVAGESMGGAVVLDTIGEPAFQPDGVILVSPAVWARSTMPLVNRVALWIGARVMPGETFTGEGLGVLASDNFPILRGLSRDPLFIKHTRVDAIYGLADLMDAALASAPHDTLPSLVLIGAHDEIVPAEPMRDFATELPGLASGRQRLAYYPDGWHMLLRDIEGPLVAEDVAAWVYDHAVPLPTGADKNVATFLRPQVASR